MKTITINYFAQSADSVLMDIITSWQYITEKQPHYLDIFCSDYALAKPRIANMVQGEAVYILISCVDIQCHYADILSEEEMYHRLKEYHPNNSPMLYRVTCCKEQEGVSLPEYQIERYL